MRFPVLLVLAPLFACASSGPPPPDPLTIGDPQGLEAVVLADDVRAYLAPGIERLNGERPLWMAPIEVRYRDGVSRNGADLDVDWGRQALRGALVRDLERSGFRLAPKSLPGGMRLEIVVHGVDPDMPRSRPVVIEAQVFAVDGARRELLLVVAPPGGSSSGGMLSFWGEGQSDIGAWSSEVVEALVLLRDGLPPRVPGTPQ